RYWRRAPMPNTLPVAVGADCRTTHYACRCVMEQLEKAEAEVERLKRLALQEGYPDGWWHAIIHLNPETGEVHSDGDHRVRHYIKNMLERQRDQARAEVERLRGA